MENRIVDGIAEFIGMSVFATSLLIILLTIVFIVLYIVGNVLLFKKCKQKGWKAIIPFYSDYVFLVDICKLHWGWCLGYLVVSFLSLGNLIFRLFKMFVSGIAFYNLAIKTEKNEKVAMIFGAILSPVLKIIYGLGDIEYIDRETKPSGLF